jgi:hypothetical protein
MPLTVINGPVIAAGESLSEGVDLAGGQLVRITAAREWNGRNISFQISSDGNEYNDLYTADGNEVVIPCGAGRAIVIEAAWWKAIAFLKIRSGTVEAPDVQTDRQEFAVAIWSDVPAP